MPIYLHCPELLMHYLFIVQSYWCTTATELSSCERQDGPQTLTYVLSSLLWKKFADSCNIAYYLGASFNASAGIREESELFFKENVGSLKALLQPTLRHSWGAFY